MKKTFLIIASAALVAAVVVAAWAWGRNGYCDHWGGFCDCAHAVVAEDSRFEQIHEGYRVVVSSYDGKITLSIPVEWEYEAEQETGGIRFWVPGQEDAVVSVRYYGGAFGVCGTGLKETPITFRNGLTGSAGYYDNNEIWEFISFGGDYAITHTCPNAWWKDYGGEVTEILHTLTIETK